MSATLSAALLSMAGLVIPALVNALLQWAQGKQDLATAKSDGAREADDAANKVSADVQSKMSAANAAPRSRDIAIGGLRDGSF